MSNNPMYRDCLYCGKTFRWSRSDQYYCGPECVSAMHRERGDEAPFIHAELPHYKGCNCEQCGGAFWINDYANRGGKRAPKYCSSACRQKAYRARQKAAKSRQKSGSAKQGPKGQAKGNSGHSGHSGKAGGQSTSRADWRAAYSSHTRAAEAILNLKPGWSADDLRKAYRAAARAWHPDHCQEANATDMMQRVNWAYTYLK